MINRIRTMIIIMLIRIPIIIIMLILEAVELHDMSVVMPHRDATS